MFVADGSLETPEPTTSLFKALRRRKLSMKSLYLMPYSHITPEVLYNNEVLRYLIEP